MGRLGPALVLLALPLLQGSYSDYRSALQKIELIRSEQAPSKSNISFSSKEINAYAQGELPAVVPNGVDRPVVELGDGWATGSALIDFLKLRQAGGEPPGWILSKLLAGERPVSVRAAIRSANGLCTVHLQRVEISGVPIQGAALNFLIDNFLKPLYPEAKIGEPFRLQHRVERIEVARSGVRVAIGH